MTNNHKKIIEELEDANKEASNNLAELDNQLAGIDKKVAGSVIDTEAGLLKAIKEKFGKRAKE
jgi:hypothetical protein